MACSARQDKAGRNIAAASYSEVISNDISYTTLWSFRVWVGPCQEKKKPVKYVACHYCTLEIKIDKSKILSNINMNNATQHSEGEEKIGDE